MAEPPLSSGRVSRRVLFSVLVIALVVVVTIVARRHKLDSLGTLRLGPGPLETYVVSNRSDTPHLLRVTWSDDSTAPVFLPARSTADVEVPVAPSGMGTTEILRAEVGSGPGHLIEWTTATGEELTITFEADGRETREVYADDSSEVASLRLRCLLDRPVLVTLDDLKAIGGRWSWQDESLPPSLWLGPSGQHSPRGIRLDSGVAARLQYRVADLQLVASAKVDSSEGASHQVVIGADGSVSAGSLSLRTRAGY